MTALLFFAFHTTLKSSLCAVARDGLTAIRLTSEILRSAQDDNGF
jgi:hypothetical protein